jgi:hypothetical protein
MEHEAASGLILRTPSAYYDRHTRSLKTCQDSFLLMLEPDSTESSPTWPKWGTLLNGRVYPLPMLERHTAESGCSLWPTPNCMDTLPARTGEKYHKAMTWDGRTNRKQSGVLRDAVANSGVENEAKAWATPRASPNENRTTKLTPSQQAGKHGEYLAVQAITAANWPTPQATDGAKGGPNQRHGSGDQPLPGAVATAASSSPSPAATSGKAGSLSVPFVEELMGFGAGYLPD